MRARRSSGIRDDFNGAEQEGPGIYQVTQHEGERWSAARGYIHPVQLRAARPNFARLRRWRRRPASSSRGARRRRRIYAVASRCRQRPAREVILRRRLQSPHLRCCPASVVTPRAFPGTASPARTPPGVGKEFCRNHPGFSCSASASDAPYFAGSVLERDRSHHPGHRAVRLSGVADDLQSRRMQWLP